MAVADSQRDEAAVTAATTAKVRRPGLAGIAIAAWADTRSRRWAIVAALGSWIVFSLAAGGGMLQYAPQGWDLPLHAWLTYRSRTPYAMYVLAEHWAVVAVPLYVAQAMAVAALAATYVLLATYAKRCGVVRRISGPIGIGGLVVGSLGAAGCCSTLAIALAAVVGPGVAASLTGVAFWVPAVLFAVAIAWQAARLHSVGPGAPDRCRHERYDDR